MINLTRELLDFLNYNKTWNKNGIIILSGIGLRFEQTVERGTLSRRTLSITIKFTDI